MAGIFFNLLTNSIFSLAAGLLVTWFFIWLFRVETGRWKLLLLSFPFLKLVYDCLRGIPAQSVLFSHVDPFALPPNSQILTVGVGFDFFWGPILNVNFAVKDPGGTELAASVGDYVVFWLHRTLGSEIPLLILAFVIGVSVSLLCGRIAHVLSFERRRKAGRPQAVSLRRQRVGAREVDIYISESYSGSPFTGGIVKPYICFPAAAHRELSAAEIEAVIAHEIGHIRQYDVVFTAIVQILGDIFWFIPGYRWLSRKIDRLRELVADQSATRSGIAPVTLASALVKLKEMPVAASREPILYSAFFREKSLLKLRVQRLLGDGMDRPARLGWGYRWARPVVTIWIFSAVMMATFGGNHPNLKGKSARVQRTDGKVPHKRPI
jgi:hypothetical protein